MKVVGNTDLKGAVIASTDKAVEDSRNRFSTAQLTTSDINNRADYKADSSGVALGYGSSAGTPNLSGAGIGKDSGHAKSTTTSGISGIAGNKDVRSDDPETGIAKIFDADKVQKEINAQVQITQAFSQQANKAVADYVQTEGKALREALKSADEDKKIIIQKQLDDLLLQERVMNVLIGAVTGMGGAALTKESLSVAADKMREITIENSLKFKGIVDGDETFTNFLEGKSEGIRGDGKGIGGTRADLDNICGPSNERCMTETDANGNKALLLKDGKVQWNREAVNGMTLFQYLDSTDGQKAAGVTGGIQGWKGTLFGEPYIAGSWQDKLIEAFGGTHDFIGGQITGLYDEQGSTKRGMSDLERLVRDRISELALIPSAPFAAAELLPPEVWSAISILLKASK